MVSVVQLRPQGAAAALDALAAGLASEERALVARTLDFAEPLYAGQTLSTGEPVWPHALGLAASLAAIGMDPAARAAGVLFAAPKYLGGTEKLVEAFGAEIAALAGGVEKLYQLRVLTRANAAQQSEILRKMVLGMVEDIRVVLIRLASRTQTLRWYAKHAGEERAAYARETLDIYAPLANRLGVWQLKWELEDLSFRFLEPELYRKIAKMLDERRVEREQYIAEAMTALARELEAAGVKGEVHGRPKHIYSIWNKMRAKGLDFAQVHDVRALRVIVPSVKDCYAALGVVHNLWVPIAREFDDYISRPKGNLYQSLHTAVIGPGGKTLEVQIRTEDMHRHAELGVAAHWRYKEAGKATRADSAFDDKIAWLRQLLAWRDEVAEGASWAERTQRAALDDTIYVVTPQGKVVDLPAGATPIDFAYALHTDLGHRCRGAKVDGHLVPLDTPLKSGQRVELTVAKTGGPSRDWMSAERGFAKSPRARQKIRQWFNAQALTETVAEGRAIVEREVKREGRGGVSLEALAAKLGLGKPDDLFAAVARDEVNLRQLHEAMRALAGAPAPAEAPASAPAPRKRKSAPESGVLVVGMDRLLTQLAKCCKPVPPDPIRGFVTRGRGVSIHREDCASLKRLAQTDPARLIEAAWGAGAGAYSVDMVVTASDRPGLLRDIGDALARERINVTAVRTQSRDELAFMRFAFEVGDVAQLKRAFAVVREVGGVIRVARG
ncbi:MAG TPA: bifunctional (p)ppGpp synthetase/guanosine-3',5'-bis(diphosphate) 3'-pyrophosphohydrolase [Burkholderiales bacterium]|jgi:GTP pyrophosphokinase|nr:bifunctional (p)ppGpp synthetase/guanosine-3',5'-bis(diphosphate) 3'-pyrophosphohydrolase [Burkholderiales bacterium]